MRIRNLFIILLAVALIAGGGFAWLLKGEDGSGWTPPDSSVGAAPNGLEKFYRQNLSWQDCGAESHCAWVEVPVDYAAPNAATLKLRVKLLAAGMEAKRALFVNPGGPGGSAMDFVSQLSGTLSWDVRKQYDVVGVDPRGVGMSTPITCVDDRTFDELAAMDPAPDTPEEVAASQKAGAEFVRGCEQKSGELSLHVSTEEAARDMDVVRALLGHPKFDWFGASYGTQLGATYATLFPENVGRMVLDGAVDPSLSIKESSLGQTRGFQRALSAYLASCVKDECPLGDSVDAAEQRLAKFLTDLDAEPLKVGKRQLTEGLAFYGVALPLYDRTSWSYLTLALSSALDGDGTMLLMFADAYFDRQADGTYGSNIGQVNGVVNCADAADRPSVKQVESWLPEFEAASPVFGPAMGWGVAGCSDWPKLKHPQVKIDGAGAPPILILGTTRDPATPYEWAESLAQQLASGVLVTREGDGHTAFMSGNKCIAKIVNEFLADGAVPDDGTRCTTP